MSTVDGIVGKYDVTLTISLELSLRVATPLDSNICVYLQILISVFIYTFYIICAYLTVFQARSKSDKNRQRILDNYNKLAHQQRTELAQQRKEERLKAETERYMNEEDPVKARKMEVCYLVVLNVRQCIIGCTGCQIVYHWLY